MLSKYLFCQLIIILFIVTYIIELFVLDNKKGHIVIAQETLFPESRFNTTSPLPEINEERLDTAIPELGLGPLPTPFEPEAEEIQPPPEGTPAGEQIIRVRTVCDLLGSVHPY